VTVVAWTCLLYCPHRLQPSAGAVIEAAAQRDGVCITTLRRAKFDLGVLSTKESVSGAWYWALPQTASHQINRRPK
jgi:hypothetical protein